MQRTLTLVLAFVCLSPAAVAETAPTPTRTIMQGIFVPMSALLGASFDEKDFSAPDRQAALTAQVHALVTNVHALEEHASTQDRAFEFVAKSLGRDARQLERFYAKGRFDEARFTLHNMTDNCIACHSGLPETRRFPGADAFFASVKSDALSPLELAYFQVVTRRFDDALATYEAVFTARSLDPAIVPILGAFSDYLRLAISAKGDFARPRPVIESLLKRNATPLHIRMQLERWLFALTELEKRAVFSKTSVADARQVLDEGRALMQFPRDRDGLIQFVTAEAMLTRFVHAHKDGGREVAEAYYLMGIAAPLSEHSFWLTRSDFYLESAIRLAPSAPFAPKAYQLLEESLVAGYSGSSGTHVPDDVRNLLSELKRLIEQEHGKS